MSKTAHIIALRASSIAGWAGLGFGIKEMDTAADDMIFGKGEVWVGPRPVLEVDTNFVQPIPYIVIKDGEKVLTYIRSPKGGEARLHAKAAIGFGGHIDVVDVVTDDAQAIDLRATLTRAALRELAEELNVEISEDLLKRHPELLRWSHIIHSEATPVDAVHIGFVASIDLGVLPQREFSFEDAISSVERLTPAELISRSAPTDNNPLELETWTHLVLHGTTPAAA